MIFEVLTGIALTSSIFKLDSVISEGEKYKRCQCNKCWKTFEFYKNKTCKIKTHQDIDMDGYIQNEWEEETDVKITCPHCNGVNDYTVV